jgi:hypothetical protein
MVLDGVPKKQNGKKNIMGTKFIALVALLILGNRRSATWL